MTENMISAVLSQGLLSKIVSQFLKKLRIHEITPTASDCISKN